MSFLGSLLSIGGPIAGVLALDAFSALLNGPKSKQSSSQLKNKAFRSDAYGTPWLRCRGTVRCQGKSLWGTPIRTSIWKTTSGGLFGLGQTSVYYNKYSQSYWIGFGKKLGGGTAAKILRIWADGKLLFNSVASDGVITGTVTVSTITGGQLEGAQTILFDLASGATLKLNPGDLIEVPGDPGFTYEVQLPVNSTGVATSVPVTVWPPLRVDLAGGGALTVVGLNSSPYDLSSFDPDPHDGSHKAGGYDCPPGGIRFYLGADDQQPDPAIVKMLGVGNVPGYRGSVGVMIHDLQLANYGDHPPQITAEVAYDNASGVFPLTGPIADSSGTVLVISATNSFALPSSGPSSLPIFNPLTSQLPYIFLLAVPSGGSVSIYRINTITNQIEASVQLISNWSPIVADAEGFVYQVGPSSLNHWDIYKWDGLTMRLMADYGPGNSGANQPSIGQPATLQVWEMQPSLFGNPVKVKLVAMLNALGGINFFDANSMLAFGVPSAGGGNPLVEYQLDKNGSPSSQPGIVTSAGIATAVGGGGTQNGGMCIDGDGNLWVSQNSTLSMFNCQFQSGVDVKNLQPVLLPPTFARTDYDISAYTVNGTEIYYNASDNSIVLGAAARLGIASGLIVASGGPGVLGNSSSSSVDLMGAVLDAANPVGRYDVNSLTRIAQYTLSNWLTGVAPAGLTYDLLTDTLWFVNATDGKVYRAALDRGNGLGIGIDLIVASIMAEAGYDSSEYDVTQLTSSGITVYGVEFESETFVDSLRKLMDIYLFDAAPVDGKIVFIPRGNASIITIPEDDLGALSEPDKYEPRAVETIQDPLDTPELVRVHYYDPLKNDQAAVQEAKRISQPYASSLSSGKAVTSSRQKLDIVSPVTENATPMKQQAVKILWDKWTGRTVWKIKLGPKYSRLITGDVIAIVYKSVSYLLRIEELNYGASGAIEITARSVDNSVYSSAHLPSSSGGLGSGTKTTQPPVTNDTYTLIPVNPLSSPNSTTIEIAACVASFTSGLRTSYAERTIANGDALTVPDPGSGLSAIYYVTIEDPSFTGDQPAGTPSLTVLFDLDPKNVHLGETGFINLGAVTVLGSGATTTTPNPLPGGQPQAGSDQFADGVTPAGTIDGSNLIFTLADLPLGTPIVEVDGLNPVPGAASFGYTLVGATLTFTDPPQRSVLLWYRF